MHCCDIVFANSIVETPTTTKSEHSAARDIPQLSTSVASESTSTATPTPSKTVQSEGSRIFPLLPLHFQEIYCYFMYCCDIVFANSIVENPTTTKSEHSAARDILQLSTSVASETVENDLDTCIRNSEESPRKLTMDDHDDDGGKGFSKFVWTSEIEKVFVHIMVAKKKENVNSRLPTLGLLVLQQTLTGKRPVEGGPSTVDSRGTKKSKGDEPSFQSILQLYHDVQKENQLRMSNKVEPARVAIDALYSMGFPKPDFWKAVDEITKHKHKAYIFLALRPKENLPKIDHYEKTFSTGIVDFNGLSNSIHMSGAGPSTYRNENDEDSDDMSSNIGDAAHQDFLDLLMLHLFHQYQQQQQVLNAQNLESPESGAQYAFRVLNHPNPVKLYDVTRLNHATYFALRGGLLDNGFWVEHHNDKVLIDEALFLFLYMVAGDQTIRTTKDRFERLKETLSRTICDMAEAIARDHFPADGDREDDIAFQAQQDAEGPYIGEF
ncbi:OLC1v1036349C1 [Oldenlandia corymbosa var. corymbosa]|uniref:OLC1v1036349C1 n=1 Tax=Oldenlandia corymbosa var. corymbosa TaxID=529605 RepID=A0AAV1CYC3_OLDCO|nr:OLC1v1036349C1 [Oldenlandia corymbosa var. corymbosa]